MAPRASVTSQSPVDLGSAVHGTLADITISYGKSVVHGHDTRTSLEFPVAGGSSITYDGRRYELKQFHFHTPSEHAIDGEYAAAEAHFVNEADDGSVLVVGVFADASEAASGPRRLGQAVPLSMLLPDSTTHYAYIGSLTTPPFTEGVQWIVLTDRVAMRLEWIEAFRTRYGANNRGLQPLNERVITLG